jgi:hypothetical protein
MVSTRNLLIAGFTFIWVVGVIAWGFMMYHLVKAQRGYHGDRRWWPWVLGGTVFFFPQFFTDEGNRHRVRMLVAAAIFAGLVGALFAIGLFIRK